MATGETVVKVLRLWAENWPNREVTPETVRLYHRALAEVPDEVLEAAALECLKKCTYWPTVSEVLAGCHLPEKRGLTVTEARALARAAYPELADEAVVRAKRYQQELRRRAWRDAHWAETVALDARLWEMEHGKAVGLLRRKA